MARKGGRGKPAGGRQGKNGVGGGGVKRTAYGFFFLSLGAELRDGGKVGVCMFVQLVVDDAIVIVCILARDESARCTWCKREEKKKEAFST